MTNPSQIRFAADRMLGRLARMLRLLGYDTLYSSAVTLDELREIARRGDRVVLTRGHAERRFPELARVRSLSSDHAPDQLREVVERFELDPRQGLWTRCTLCNQNIEKVEKASVRLLVPAKAFEVYEQFFRCVSCGHVYWQGSHVERILKNLEAILGGKDE